MLFLRSPSVARRAFGFSGTNELVRAVPRARFLFFTEFVLSDAGRAMTANADLNTYSGNRGLSFKVRQIDKPKINLMTADLNQYNKKKVIYTRVEYPEMSLKMYDTVDNSPLTTWIDYFTYYFGDSRVKSDQRAYTQSPSDPLFIDDSGFGLRPLAGNTQFFDRIRVLAFYARTITAFSYINPKITTVDWQSYDYNSTELAEITVNFKYEAIEYEQFGRPLSQGDLQRYGWLGLDALDIPNASTQTQVPSYPVPRIFDPNPSSLASLVPFIAQPPVTTDEDAEQIQRYFGAPGAVAPTPSTETGTTFGGIEPSFGEAERTQIIIENPGSTTNPNASVSAVEERPEAAQAAARQRDALSRQAAIDAGLIAPNSSASVQAVETVAGIPVRVRIDGEIKDLELTPEQDLRVERARWLIRTGRMNPEELYRR